MRLRERPGDQSARRGRHRLQSRELARASSVEELRLEKRVEGGATFMTAHSHCLLALLAPTPLPLFNAAAAAPLWVAVNKEYNLL